MKNIFYAGFLLVCSFANQLSWAGELVTCHTPRSANVETSVVILKANFPDYNSPDAGVLYGAMRFYQVSTSSVSSGGTVKIDGLGDGYYQVRHLINNNIIRSQNIAIFSGTYQMDCTPGLKNGEFCSILNPWVTDCLAASANNSVEQCVDWCKPHAPAVPVTPTPSQNETEDQIIIEDDDSDSGDIIIPF